MIIIAICIMKATTFESMQDAPNNLRSSVQRGISQKRFLNATPRECKKVPQLPQGFVVAQKLHLKITRIPLLSLLAWGKNISCVSLTSRSKIVSKSSMSWYR